MASCDPVDEIGQEDGHQREFAGEAQAMGPAKQNIKEEHEGAHVKRRSTPRKLARDLGAGRGGHDEKYLRTQFDQAWKMNLLHVAPTRLHAGVKVVNNDDGSEWDALVDDCFNHILIP